MYSFSSIQQYSKSGNSTNFIHFVNYPGETPILDFRHEAYSSSNQGVKISGSYVHLKGMIIQGAGDNGLQVTGSYNKIENCTMRWNCDSGLQMKTGSNNLILNCDSYENFDYKSGGITSPDYGGNADGFADKQYTNSGTNTYKGCRSWRNGDDGAGIVMKK
ncbi:MAG: right-handed parallel beta-helix repeat-containing protein [Paludibacter sp.]|nr:right-handed parallel beta-helix repeat-containing protein [Paludibacter sp.]